MKNLLQCFILLILFAIFFPIKAQWQQHIIDPFIDRSAFIVFGDLDGDGDLDGAATCWGDGYVAWYRNMLPDTNWAKNTIDNNMGSAWGLVIEDVDGNDTLDIVACMGNNDDDVIWYKNKGGIIIEWDKVVIDPNLDGAGGVYIEDIDGDEDMDMAVTAYSSNLVLWYENDGGTPITWQKHTIDSYLERASSVLVVDIDDDGNMDVVACGIYADSVVWYKNDGGMPITWTEFTIDSALDGSYNLDVADMDADNDSDVVATGNVANVIVWYENLGGMPVEWNKRIIDSSLNRAFGVDIADVDLDLDLDVLATGRNDNDVVWYENDLPDTNWEKHFIDSNFLGPRGITAADIDNDGDLDAIANGWDANKIVWYENPIKPDDVQYEANVIPDEYSISQNYPNPFNPVTTIKYQIPELSFVTIKVFDVLGNEITVLVNEEKSMGSYEVELDGTTLPSGVYFYRIQAGDFIQTKKMVLMK
jgi:hypothetical protein